MGIFVATLQQFRVFRIPRPSGRVPWNSSCFMFVRSRYPLPVGGGTGPHFRRGGSGLSRKIIFLGIQDPPVGMAVRDLPVGGGGTGPPQ